MIKRLCSFLLLVCTIHSASAQLFFRGTLKANREKLYHSLVKNSIQKNMSLPISDSTQENWQSAFEALLLLRYQSPWVQGKLNSAAQSMTTQSVPFQQSLLNLFNAQYPQQFYQPVFLLWQQTDDPKTFAMCTQYLMQCNPSAKQRSEWAVVVQQKLMQYPYNAILQQLMYSILPNHTENILPTLQPFFDKNYLKGKVLVFSFQRKNRDYPGLCMVRDASGNFVTDSNGNYFSVPQLARSLSNMPGYISNGNTPQGIFRMDGYDVSRAAFIGPTVNVQLSMPFERNARHFYADSTITDTTWDIKYYRNLLPASWQNYYPIFQSYYAGKAGRTEIIIHGSTVNPQYYAGQVYYPLTPTNGCLTSKEYWDEATGVRTQSDQQLLINALIKAGGPRGYAIVIELNNEQRAVSRQDILPLIKKAQPQMALDIPE